MINLKIKNEDNKKYAEYKLMAGNQIDNLTLGMLRNNEIEGLAPEKAVQRDEDKFFVYDISDTVTLPEYLGESVKKEKLLKAFYGISLAIKVGMEYMINWTSFVLDHDSIYINPETNEVKIICIPLISMINDGNTCQFFKNILFTAQFDQDEDGDYVGKLITLLNPKTFTIDKFIEELENLLEIEHREFENCIIIDDDDEEEEKEVSSEEQVEETETESAQEPSEETPAEDSEEKKEEESVEISAEETQQEQAEEVPSEDETKETVKENEEAAAKEQNEEAVAEETETTDEQSKETPVEETTEEQNEEAPAEETTEEQSKEAPAEEATDEQSAEAPVEKSAEEQSEETPVEETTEEQNEEAPVKENVAEEKEETSSEETAQDKEPVEETPVVPDKPVAPAEGQVERKRNGLFKLLTQPITIGGKKDTVKPFIVKSKSGEKIYLEGDRFIIGSSDNADFVIKDDPAVKENHAYIVKEGEEYFLVDNESVTGTFMNGAELLPKEKYPLPNLVHIRVGNEDFDFNLHE